MKPAEDLPFIISERKAADIEPAVDPISAAVSALYVVRTARLVSPLLRRNGVLKVIGVNDVGGFPTFQLLECLAKVFEGWLVNGFDFTSRCCDCHWNRNAVDYQLETKFARPQCFFSSRQSLRKIVIGNFLS